MSRKSPPEIEPSRHCSKPYGCDFWDYCTREKPEHWIYRMYSIGQNRLGELFYNGYPGYLIHYPNISPCPQYRGGSSPVSITQREHLDPELPRELSRVAYPIHFLDFETLGPAIPLLSSDTTISNHSFSVVRPYTLPGRVAHPPGIPITWRQEITREEFTKKFAGSPWGKRGHRDLTHNHEAGVIQVLSRAPAPLPGATVVKPEPHDGPACPGSAVLLSSEISRIFFP